MGRVIFENSVSLDGYVAGPNDGPENGLGDGGEALFAWYNSGDVALRLSCLAAVFACSITWAQYPVNWKSCGWLRE